MTSVELGFAGLLLLLFLVYSGFPVAMALMLSAYVGVWAIKGSELLAAKLLGLAGYDTLNHYHFGVIPLFVLMGLVVAESGIARDAFDVANHLLRKVLVGLGVATIAANALFAAITGISIASAAVFTRIAVPQMIQHGYTARFATGLVAGSSVLGMLIPPSMLLILYGIVTEQSVGDLFMAGILPGLLLASVFSIGVILMAKFLPRQVGIKLTVNADQSLPLSAIVSKSTPVVAIISLVLGGIYLGVFTPVEASAAGCVAVLLVALLKRRMSWAVFCQCLKETGHVSANIGLLIIGASMFSRMLTLSGVPVEIAHWLLDANLSATGLILIYLALIILFGTILDSASTMLIVVPLFLPVFAAMQVDLVWLGIITVIAVEIGLLTPPLGMAVYVVNSSLEQDSVSLSEVFLGALPFWIMMLITLMVLLLVPSIATVLV